jgi:DNA-directed RNA polymerase subunit K/omega
VADRTDIPNAFEFVIVAGARARQLLRGCTPRTTGPAKLVRVAQQEVKEGKVAKVLIDPQSAIANRQSALSNR